jgi:hypothetical protein
VSASWTIFLLLSGLLAVSFALASWSSHQRYFPQEPEDDLTATPAIPDPSPPAEERLETLSAVDDRASLN